MFCPCCHSVASTLDDPQAAVAIVVVRMGRVCQRRLELLAGALH